MNAARVIQGEVHGRLRLADRLSSYLEGFVTHYQDLAALRHAVRTQVQLDSSSQYSSPRSLHLFSLLDASLPPDSSIDRSAQPSTDLQ